MSNTLGANVTVSYEEYEAVVEDYSASEREVRRLRRHVTTLERELNESTSPENKKVRECCEHHAENWKRVFPRSKGLTYKMESSSAVAVRRALRLKFTVEEINSVTDYIFASEFHLTKRDYLMMDSYLSDDRRIYKHLENIEKQQAEAAERRIDEGLKQVSQALRVPIEDPIDRVLRALEAQDLEWRASRWGDPDFAVNLWHARCPVCSGPLTVTVNENRAHPACESCDEARVLVGLGLVPGDLTRRFVPEPPLRGLPPLGSPVLFELEAAA